MKIQLPGEENKQNEEAKAEAAPEDEEILEKLLNELRVSDLGITSAGFSPAEFEKDDDTNFHIDFIHFAANLRARNYKITECPQQKTKMIAGKIIPAIATTTAMITGAVSAEIFKFVQGKTAIVDFKNAFINLALPLFVFTEPDEAKKIKSKEFDPIMCGPVKALPEDHTIWDKVVVKGPMTHEQLFAHLKERLNIEVTLVSCGKVALYNAYLPNNKHAPRL